MVLAKFSDICGIRESHQGFCFTRYMVGNDYLVSDIHVGRPQACLGSAYRLVAGDAGSGSLLERWKVGGARVFRWKVRIGWALPAMIWFDAWTGSRCKTESGENAATLT